MLQKIRGPTGNSCTVSQKAPNGNPTLNAAKTKGTHFKPTRNPLPMLQKPGEPAGNPLGTHWGTHFKCSKTHWEPTQCCKNQGTHWELMHGELESAQW